jgi:four helix bundle protein
MSNRDDSVVLKKSFEFAVKIVRFTSQLNHEKHFILSRQLLRSGTSIGANINEALAAYSKKDFIYKMMLALKEAQEAEYWLKLIAAAEIIENFKLSDYSSEIIELQKMLTSIIKTSKSKLNEGKHDLPNNQI